jgi:glycosyltransferase involved in cell wall biosynthesis
MNDIQISIIVPCYNQGEFLNETLSSIIKQTFSNWECIIIDDGSSDNTKEIAKIWLEKDTRFRYFYQKNQGVSIARNFGIEKALGEFILPLDADDKIASEYIRLSLNEFKNNNNLTLVYCQARKFGKINEKWLLPEFNLFDLAVNNMIFCSSIFKKSDWKRIGGYDENMVKGFEDWEFYIALLKKGGAVSRLDYTGFYYRIEGNSRSKKINQEVRDSLFEYLSIKHADFFVHQLGSFFHLRSKMALIESNYKENLKSEKFVIDLFLYRFFKFTIFGKYRP